MRVTYSEIYSSTGKVLTIGSAMSDLKEAYLEAIEVASLNGNTSLTETLEKALRAVCEADGRVLGAICQQ